MAAQTGAPRRRQAPEAPAVGTELTSDAAAVGPAEAERIAREVYGLCGRAEWLWGEKDSNYRLTLPDGTARLLKILSPAEDPSVTAMHARALMHLEAADPGIPVQRVIRTRDGAPDRRIEVEAGGERTVRMVSFLEGVSQRGRPRSPAQRREIGRLMGRMQTALEGFEDPALLHPIAWDMTHACGLRGKLDAVEDPARRARLARILDDHEATILPRLPELPAQAIHNDFNPNNILIHATDLDRVTGIIDFGDIVRAPALFDVAVAVCYQMEALDDPVPAACEFLEGYAEHRTLSTLELSLLQAAVMTRIVLRVAIPAWRARLLPDHRARLNASLPTVWAQLDRLDQIPPDAMTDRFAAVFAGDRP
ncbi:phosphotransferase [Albimonas sp. CAU 1670]|uniref:phosphotransferase n=1 Tax=Albimonas sp. CAU 1670 TaxID=3032599 RepID=UPI0023DC2D76|nr:phosphotransferase [Albimonas sp. CAU 1670]MDF2235284.1 phosphotransferase [Albimonas sp. CAU 1670]